MRAKHDGLVRGAQREGHAVGGGEAQQLAHGLARIYIYMYICISTVIHIHNIYSYEGHAVGGGEAQQPAHGLARIYVYM